MLKTFLDVLKLISFAITADLPGWQKKLFAKSRDELQVHSKGELFYKIDRLFPNELPESKQHRILAFEPITKQSFWKGVTNVIEIFQNSSYTAEASEKTVKLIIQDTWENKNFFSFFLDEWTKAALSEDPNSLCVVYPPEYIKQNPTIQQVQFISSEFIKYIGAEGYIFVSIEESEKDYTLEDTKVWTERFYDPKIERLNLRETAEKTYSQKLTAKITREVRHLFTENGFYRMEQQKDNLDKWDWKFYPSKTKFIPVTTAGGKKGKTKDVQDGLFERCVPMGNLALLQHSQHTAVNFSFSFPRMSELVGDCDYELCNFGFVVCDISNEWPEGKKPCPKCHGSGETSNQSPYKVKLKKFNTSGTGDNSHLEHDDWKFYTPDVAILDYSKGEWRDYLEEFEKALFINQQVKTGDQPSAKSKETDLKDKYSFLKTIAKVFYDRLRFAIQCIENYEVGSPNQVTVTTPFSFAIVTETEAFETLNNILNSNVTVLVKANQIELFINKFISQSSPIKKAFNILKIVDKLLYYSLSDITVMKSNMIATREQWVIHAFAYPLLVQMIHEDPESFTQQTVEVISKKLLEDLKPYQQQSDTSLKAAIQEKLNPPTNK